MAVHVKFGCISVFKHLLVYFRAFWSVKFALRAFQVLTEQVCSLHLAAMRDSETPEEVPLQALEIGRESKGVKLYEFSTQY